MAKQRRSKGGGGFQTVGAIAAGLAAGTFVFPKLVSAVDAEQKIDPRIVNGIGAGGAFFLARSNMVGNSNFARTALYATAAGLALNVLASFAGMSGLGYVDSPTYDVNRVAGLGYDYSGTAGANPGSI